MLKSYLTITLRVLRKHSGYAFINVAGLGIGMAACLLMLLFVLHEVSYDRFHANADRIQRVTLTVKAGNNVYDLADAPAPVGPAMQETFPEVEEVARIKDPGTTVVDVDGMQFEEDRFYYAEPAFLDLFDFPLLRGDGDAVLRDPFTVLLTASSAHKLFGDADPIGKVVRVNNQHDFIVAGVMQDPPANTHVPFDYLAAFSTLESTEKDQLAGWGSVAEYYVYALLKPGASPAAIEEKFPQMLEGHVPTAYFSLHLQPLTDIHLRSHLGAELEENGDVTYVYLFSAIAAFILLLACINFMNLATARASTRTKEVGMRKVLGARRRQLGWQFLGESMLLSFIAMLVAIGLVELFGPAVNDLTGRTLDVSYVAHPELALALVGLVIVVGLVAGSYPAFVLSRFRPTAVLKGPSGGDTGARLRKALVVFQFAISTILLIGLSVVYRQLHYIQNAKLGFDQEQLVVIDLRDQQTQQQYQVLKRLLLQDPAVAAATASSNVPTGGFSAYFALPEGMPEDQPVVLPMYFVDYDFIDTYGLTMKRGRAFAEDRPADAANGVIVNETAVKQYGWDDPLGKQIRISGSDEPVTVIGVVDDFHFMSFHDAMRPVALRAQTSSFGRMTVRLRPGNATDAMAQLTKTWKAFAPAYPFDAQFLDQKIDAQYRSEHRLGKAATYFSGLAVLIACLGLFGLAAFTADRRTKEIGIRKVMGASVPRIIVLLSKEFAALVAIAFVLAVPIAYFALDKWLENFAYRIDLTAGLFLVSGLTALGVALLTVSYQAIRAALNDPVKALRYE